MIFIFNFMITALDISTLRASTGAGMMDCKKAMEEAGGDMEKAAEILRKKGIVKAAKRADKIAAEGLTSVVVKGDTAVVLELNSETDFVAKNDDFKKLLSDLAEAILENKPKTLEEALTSKMDGGTVEDHINNAVAKIGEKLTLRRFALETVSGSEAFGAYVHMGGKISVLITLSGTTDSELAREVAMHVAASNPKYIRREEVPAEVVDKEKEIYGEQLKSQGKPQNIIENIMKGKVDKFYGEVCLLEQPFIKDEEKTVQKFLTEKGSGITVGKMVRYELGEGLAKKSCDFAAEVAEQMG